MDNTTQTPHTFTASGQETLLAACIVLLLGVFIVRKIKVLDKYNIPEPVAGGIIAAIGFMILYKFFNWQVNFNDDLKNTLMLAFFSSIGLSADLKRLAQGGKPLVIFLLVAAGLILLQNTVGILAAIALGQNALYGLIAGSVALSGGHGTAGAWGFTFANDYNLKGAAELGIACATFGLVLGGMIGGPVAHRLIKKLGRKPQNQDNDLDDGIAFENPKKLRLINTGTLLSVITMMAICIFIGNTIYQYVDAIPAFVWCLFTGVIIRNVLSHVFKHRVHDRAVDVVGNTALSLFLAIALMSLKLWEMAELAMPIFVILILQTILMICYSYFITFKAMGKDYDAAVLSAGHCGFGMGATPTAIANMQAITKTFGPSPKAFLIVPMVGAFFIDIINAAFINIFIAITNAI